jgi:8-oxo-(d)GTP phosphatase
MGSKEPEVLLVHRRRLEDWSFPKGKLDRGEPAYTAAVREVQEETGLTVSLGPRLPEVRYTISSGQPKVVQYWCAAAPQHADITTYRPNDEIDDLRWVPAKTARRRLSYPYDVDLLESFTSTGFASSPLIVVRHARARNRKTWKDDDSERPLSSEGKEQAHRLVALLRAYGIRRVVTSDAVRCVDTVLPFANDASAKVRLDPSIAEDTFDQATMLQHLRSELDGAKRVAICTHRPMLPSMIAALGLPPVALDPAGLLVAHRRAGHVTSVEHYPSP